MDMYPTYENKGKLQSYTTIGQYCSANLTMIKSVINAPLCSNQTHILWELLKKAYLMVHLVYARQDSVFTRKQK